VKAGGSAIFLYFDDLFVRMPVSFLPVTPARGGHVETIASHRAGSEKKPQQFFGLADIVCLLMGPVMSLCFRPSFIS